MHQLIPSWRSISCCSKVEKSSHMNQYLRYIEIHLSCVVFGMCCQRGRVFLSYLFEICLRKVYWGRIFYVILSLREITKRERVYYLRGRIVLFEKDLFSNFILLWHVVLPSMPKREIVGYNCLIVCCLWCYTNVISVIR